MSSAKPFTRFGASRRGFFRRASIWDAGEYLLSISGTAYSERYKRFYYRDIQALVVQKGPRLGSLGVLVMLFFAIPMFLSMGLATPFVPLRWLWVLPLLAFGFFLCRNLLQGCRVFVYTAVSTEELPAIIRRGPAAKVLPQILEKIQTAQGSFSEAYSEAALQGLLLVENSTTPMRMTADVGERLAVSPKALYGSLFYFLAMLGNAAFAFWYRNTLLIPTSLLTAKILFGVFNIFGAATGVWALVSVFKIRLLGGLRAVIFVGLGLLGMRSYALYFVLIALKVANGSLYETMVAVRWRQWLGTADCALSLLVAIIGLIVVSSLWQTKESAPVVEGSDADNSVAGGSISSL